MPSSRHSVRVRNDACAGSSCKPRHLPLVRADASQRGWYACNGVAVHAASRAPLNKALGVKDMTTIRVRVNGVETWTLGGPEMPQVGVYVGNHYKSNKITVSYNAYRNVGPNTTEHFEWPDRVLAVGDDITITVEAEGEPSQLAQRSTFDNRPRTEELEKQINKLVAEARLDGKGPSQLPPEAAARSDYYCSFCAKHSTEVATLIAGVCVCICNECVTTCQDVIAKKAKGS